MLSGFFKTTLKPTESTSQCLSLLNNRTSAHISDVSFQRNVMYMLNIENVNVVSTLWRLSERVGRVTETCFTVSLKPHITPRRRDQKRYNKLSTGEHRTITIRTWWWAWGSSWCVYGHHLITGLYEELVHK